MPRIQRSGAGIRRNGETEPQLPISAPKYTWVKFQILLECIYCESICPIDSGSSDWEVAAPLVGVFR